MKRLAHRFWFWALVQACLGVAILGWKFYAGTTEYLAHPSDGDLYAHTWSFQAIAFSFFAVPLFIVCMIVLLGVEWFIVRMISKRQVIESSSVG